MLNVGWFVGEMCQGDFIIVSVEAYVVYPSGVGKAVVVVGVVLCYVVLIVSIVWQFMV